LERDNAQVETVLLILVAVNVIVLTVFAFDRIGRWLRNKNR
jgi:hypothetical protein